MSALNTQIVLGVALVVCSLWAWAFVFHMLPVNDREFPWWLFPLLFTAGIEICAAYAFGCNYKFKEARSE